MITITQAAMDIGVSPDQARYWCQLLSLATHKMGRNRYLDTHGVEQIREMCKMTITGKTPQEAAAILTATPVVVPTESAMSAKQEPDIQLVARLEGIENALLVIAKDNRVLREGMNRLVNTITQQEQEIVALRLRLEPPPIPEFDPPKPVKAWEPVRLQPAPIPWYERLWLQMFNPEMLRITVE